MAVGPDIKESDIAQLARIAGTPVTAGNEATIAEGLAGIRAGVEAACKTFSADDAPAVMFDPRWGIRK